MVIKRDVVVITLLKAQTTLIKEKSKNKRIRQLPCLHMFCEECILPWIKSNYTCPTCKIKLRNDEGVDE